jgi:hypothetical protein
MDSVLSLVALDMSARIPAKRSVLPDSGRSRSTIFVLGTKTSCAGDHLATAISEALRL